MVVSWNRTLAVEIRDEVVMDVDSVGFHVDM
jgi:hypothetical protein